MSEVDDFYLVKNARLEARIRELEAKSIDNHKVAHEAAERVWEGHYCGVKRGKEYVVSEVCSAIRGEPCEGTPDA